MKDTWLLAGKRLLSEGCPEGAPELLPVQRRARSLRDGVRDGEVYDLSGSTRKLCGCQSKPSTPKNLIALNRNDHLPHPQHHNKDRCTQILQPRMRSIHSNQASFPGRSQGKVRHSLEPSLRLTLFEARKQSLHRNRLPSQQLQAGKQNIHHDQISFQFTSSYEATFLPQQRFISSRAHGQSFPVPSPLCLITCPSNNLQPPDDSASM